MVSRAEWRRHRFDPKSLPGWLCLLFVTDVFPKEEVAKLLPSPPPEIAYPTRVFLGEGWLLTGMDHATVTFNDGWMLVHGLRVFFTLKESDVTRMKRLGSKGYRLYLTDGTYLELRPTAGPVDLRGALGQALRDWRTTPSTIGVSVLPPVRAHPSALRTPISSALRGTLLFSLAALLCLGPEGIGTAPSLLLLLGAGYNLVKAVVAIIGLRQRGL